MNVTINLKSVCGLRNDAVFQADFLDAPSRASQHSSQRVGQVTVEVDGRVWLTYCNGKLRRSHDISIYDKSELSLYIEEMIDIAETLDMTLFPRRFPVKLADLK